MLLLRILPQRFLDHINSGSFIEKAGERIQFRRMFQFFCPRFLFFDIRDDTDHPHRDILLHDGGDVQLTPDIIGPTGPHAGLIGGSFPPKDTLKRLVNDRKIIRV